MDPGNAIAKEEPGLYPGEHADMPLPGMWLSFLQNDGDDLPPHYQPAQEEQPEQHHVAPAVLPIGQRTVYTCDHPGCLHHSSVYGFHTMDLLRQHLLNCEFRNPNGQFGNPVQPLLAPVGTLYQVMIPTQRMLGHQAPNPLSQQMVSVPMVLQTPSLQEVHGTFVFNNTGVSGNAAMQYGNQGMGHLDSTIHNGVYPVRDITGDEARFYM